MPAERFHSDAVCSFVNSAHHMISRCSLSIQLHYSNGVNQKHSRRVQ